MNSSAIATAGVDELLDDVDDRRKEAEEIARREAAEDEGKARMRMLCDKLREAKAKKELEEASLQAEIEELAKYGGVSVDRLKEAMNSQEEASQLTPLMGVAQGLGLNATATPSGGSL